MYLVAEVETGEVADDVGDVDDGAVVLEVYLVGGEVFEVAYGVYYGSPMVRNHTMARTVSLKVVGRRLR